MGPTDVMTRQQVLDLYFMDARSKLIDLAAFIDRVERASGQEDVRMNAFRLALAELSKSNAAKAKQVLLAFSDPTTEPKRAAKFGMPHFSWLCINPKEAEDVKLAEEVIAIIPKFLDRPNVLGIGEIGLNKNSRNELKVLELHVELAARHDQLILVHTPHLEDKLKGTRLIVDVIRNDKRIQPQRVIIDHVEEHTDELELDRGH